MIYDCYCVGEKEIVGKNGKKYVLLWVTLYDKDGFFVDCIKVFKNRILNDIKLGVVFNAEKGFNRESRETFLYNVVCCNTNTSI